MTLFSRFLSLLALGCAMLLPAQAAPATSYLTSADQQYLLSPAWSWQQPTKAGQPELSLNTNERFQSMEGFGYTLTGGSAMHLMQLSAERRTALLQELFGAKGLAVSYLRLSLGASDLDPQPFSYNDLPAGQTDPELKQFSIRADEQYLLPVLKQILAINPTIKLLASPWSPPAWMKSNQSTVGGELLEQYFPAYANYFVKYVQAMAAHGVRIDAVTVQNEPLHDGNNPSLLMHAWDQAKFVGRHLGPALKAAKLDTKIIIYDHNTDHVEYAITVLNDPVAKPFIDGSAFHLYGGEISNLAELKAAHPDKHIYFTEQWVGGKSEFADNLLWHTEHLIIGAPANWARNVLEWNLAADSEFKPYTPGGCSLCKGALTIDGDRVSRNVAYYIIGQASKVVPPGSVRIGSSLTLTDMHQIAYQRPDGQIALLLLNRAQKAQSVNLRLDQQLLPYAVSVSAQSVLSLILPATN